MSVYTHEDFEQQYSSLIAAVRISGIKTSAKGLKQHKPLFKKLTDDQIKDIESKSESYWARINEKKPEENIAILKGLKEDSILPNDELLDIVKGFLDDPETTAEEIDSYLKFIEREFGIKYRSRVRQDERGELYHVVSEVDTPISPRGKELLKSGWGKDLKSTFNVRYDERLKKITVSGTVKGSVPDLLGREDLSGNPAVHDIDEHFSIEFNGMGPKSSPSKDQIRKALHSLNVEIYDETSGAGKPAELAIKQVVYGDQLVNDIYDSIQSGIATYRVFEDFRSNIEWDSRHEWVKLRVYSIFTIPTIDPTTNQSYDKPYEFNHTALFSQRKTMNPKTGEFEKLPFGGLPTQQDILNAFKDKPFESTDSKGESEIITSNPKLITHIFTPVRLRQLEEKVGNTLRTRGRDLSKMQTMKEPVEERFRPDYDVPTPKRVDVIEERLKQGFTLQIEVKHRDETRVGPVKFSWKMRGNSQNTKRELVEYKSEGSFTLDSLPGKTADEVRDAVVPMFYSFEIKSTPLGANEWQGKLSPALWDFIFKKSPSGKAELGKLIQLMYNNFNPRATREERQAFFGGSV